MIVSIVHLPSLLVISCRNAVPAGSSFLPFIRLYGTGRILDPLVEENRPFCDQLVAEDTTESPIHRLRGTLLSACYCESAY